MIKSFVSDIARQMGVKLSSISLTDGQSLGCLDTCLLNISAKGKTVGAMIFRSDIKKLADGAGHDLLEVRIRTTLSRLKVLLER